MSAGAPPEQPILETRGLSVDFGGLTALDGLDLAVYPGEIVSVIGPNGAGKTTLFNAITATVSASEGDIRFEGESLIGLDPNRVTARGIARTFQNVRLFANMTVLENVMVSQHCRTRQSVVGALLWTKAFRREEEEIAERGKEVLSFFGGRLTGYRFDQPAFTLSYANRRRLEIARAMATQPKLILLDEPVAGMNPTESAELTGLIGRLRDEWGFAIVVIEHDMEVVREVSDRVIVLDHGVKIAEGDYDDVSVDPLVIQAYLGHGAAAGDMSQDPPDRAVPLLEMRKVNAHYGAVHALRDVNLSIYAGELVCLLGGNASGKSTTLKTLLGMLTPTSGEVVLDGEVVNGRPTSYLVARGVTMVPENRRLFKRLTVRENLQLGAYLRKDTDAVASDLERVFELFPRVKERLGQKAGTLSGGEQQMVAIGRALMSQPRVLLMDEPSMGLAPALVQQNFELISQIHEAGMTVFMVEQNANMALGIADRGWVLQTGRVVLDDTAEALLANPALRTSYLGGGKDDSDSS